MKFTNLDKEMRIFETAHDHCVLPGVYMVARIDGRCFSTLTKDQQRFEAPFDERFRDLMLVAMRRLMSCGFRVAVAYSQSDEINLLFHLKESSFGRKVRKFNSILAAETSAAFSLAFGSPVAFDCRICQLPSAELVQRYFYWRQEDASRNALNAHCYWFYRFKGYTDRESHELLMGLNNSDKHELLFTKAGINFNDLPAWQKRGFALYWQQPQESSFTEAESARRKKFINEDFDLPMREGFIEFVKSLIEENS